MCRSRVAAKILVFVISRNFCEIFNFVFCKIFLEFREIQNNFVKILCFAKFVQRCFAATICMNGGGGGGGRVGSEE